MIAGTIALISLLFFGGISELFPVDKLEKGVKQYVDEKERRDDILDDLKTSKKLIKEFNKERHKRFDTFKEMNADTSTSRMDMMGFFNDVMNHRKDFQEDLMHMRIKTLEKLTDDEWNSILEYSGIQVEKRQEKEQKKKEKAKIKDQFVNTRETIISEVSSLTRQKQLLSALDQFIESMEIFTERAAKVNVLDNDILVDKHATFDEIIEFVDQLNGLRRIAFNNLVSFHSEIKESAGDDQFPKIMKAFNKEIEITEH